MLRGVLVTFTVLGLAGAGVVALRSVGEEAEATFDSLNRTFAESARDEEKASRQDVAVWFKRYRPDAPAVRCRRAPSGWDYVCVFRTEPGRRMKVGVRVDSRQPVEMSPIVSARKQLPPPSNRAAPLVS
jgi:hypothetical protein